MKKEELFKIIEENSDPIGDWENHSNDPEDLEFFVNTNIKNIKEAIIKYIYEKENPDET